MSVRWGYFLLIAASVSRCVAAAEPLQWSFENATRGELPPGWVSAKTGKGNGSIWKIVACQRDGEPQLALAQTSSDGPRSLYNLCVATGVKQADIDLSVVVRAVAGKIDQGGGLVWRYRDPDNYYIARWNPLEDNFRVYKVQEGKRTQLATADVKLDPDEWHTLRAVQRTDHIQCYLDGKRLLDVADRTFADAGAIGLWTKADAVTWFDNLVLKAPEKD